MSSKHSAEPPADLVGVASSPARKTENSMPSMEVEEIRHRDDAAEISRTQVECLIESSDTASSSCSVDDDKSEDDVPSRTRQSRLRTSSRLGILSAVSQVHAVLAHSDNIPAEAASGEPKTHPSRGHGMRRQSMLRWSSTLGISGPLWSRDEPRHHRQTSDDEDTDEQIPDEDDIEAWDSWHIHHRRNCLLDDDGQAARRFRALELGEESRSTPSIPSLPQLASARRGHAGSSSHFGLRSQSNSVRSSTDRAPDRQEGEHRAARTAGAVQAQYSSTARRLHGVNSVLESSSKEPLHLSRDSAYQRASHDGAVSLRAKHKQKSKDSSPEQVASDGNSESGSPLRSGSERTSFGDDESPTTFDRLERSSTYNYVDYSEDMAFIVRTADTSGLGRPSLMPTLNPSAALKPVGAFLETGRERLSKMVSPGSFRLSGTPAASDQGIRADSSEQAASTPTRSPARVSDDAAELEIEPDLDYDRAASRQLPSRRTYSFRGPNREDIIAMSEASEIQEANRRSGLEDGGLSAPPLSD